MNDRRKFQDELTHGLIIIENQALFPNMDLDFEKIERDAIYRYTNNNLFYAIVNHRVGQVMSIIDKYFIPKDEITK